MIGFINSWEYLPDVIGIVFCMHTLAVSCEFRHCMLWWYRGDCCTHHIYTFFRTAHTLIAGNEKKIKHVWIWFADEHFVAPAAAAIQQRKNCHRQTDDDTHERYEYDEKNWKFYQSKFEVEKFMIFDRKSGKLTRQFEFIQASFSSPFLLCCCFPIPLSFCEHKK